MKAVILAGGLGTRISEETHLKPKPMIEIGGKPILWHIMKMHSAHGVNDFIICCGYKGYVIKEYFTNYFLHMSGVTFDMSNNKMEVHEQKAEPWRVTLNMKIRNNQGKWALRQVLYKHVPREFIERPKAGFAIPLGQWLRGPLRDWTNGLLDETRLKQESYLKPAPILQVWKEHLTGRIDLTSKLWAVLMFQSWLEVNK